MNALEHLKTHTTVAADTADYGAVHAYKVTDATTNPTIILQSASSPDNHQLLQKAVRYGSKNGNTLKDKIENATDMVVVQFGKNMLRVIPGRVHIQVDTRLAFDSQASVSRALKLVQLFGDEGVPKERLVVKLPATWEGIRAADVLQNHHHVDCNLTTMFSLAQAAAGAQASVYCVAPFVGRIRQWYVERRVQLDDHPGVCLWTEIFEYMRKFSYETKVMGAYFVNCDEVTAGPEGDFSTIPVALLEELAARGSTGARKPSRAVDLPVEPMKMTEARFRWMMNENEMATSLLSETIRKFAADCERLEAMVKDMLLA